MEAASQYSQLPLSRRAGLGFDPAPRAALQGALTPRLCRSTRFDRIPRPPPPTASGSSTPGYVQGPAPPAAPPASSPAAPPATSASNSPPAGCFSFVDSRFAPPLLLRT
eukprot:tig00021374_g21109.t1